LTKKEVLFKELDRLFKEEFTGIHLFIKGSPDDMQCKFTREFMKVLEPY
jgi:glutaredoxin-related protein